MIRIRESIMFNHDYNLKKFKGKQFNSVKELVAKIEKDTDFDVVWNDEYNLDLMDRYESDDERESFKVNHRNGKVSLEL